MIWIILIVMLVLISLYHGLTYHRAKTTWQNMTTVKGQLLEYQLNPKAKNIDPISRITKQPKVLFSYEFDGKTHQSKQLCLLDEVETAVHDHYLGPKPITVDVHVNPNEPQIAALHLGRLSPVNVMSSYIAALFFIYIGHRYFG